MGDRFVALLRGVNVGPNKRVAMADLRALVEGLGCTAVRTLQNSGNVVFSASQSGAKGIAARMEKAMETRLGVSARVIIVSSRELAEAVAAHPLREIAVNPSRLLLGFLAEPADRAKLADIVQRNWGDERIALAGVRAVFLWMPDGVIASKLNQAVSKALGDGVTARTWATILKLDKMVRTE